MVDAFDPDEDEVRLPIGVLEAINDQLGDLMSTVSDLSAAVASLANAVSGVEAHIAAGAGTTQLDAADQASLDAAVTGLQDATAKLEAIVNPPAPAAPAAPVSGSPVLDASGQPVIDPATGQPQLNP